ncbi:unnamed protein product [Sympodiomycopsis kandeliae]
MTGPNVLDFVVTKSEASRLEEKLGIAIPTSSQQDASASSSDRKPDLKSIHFWLQDSNLPSTTRVAIRSAVLAAVVNSSIQTVSTGIRQKNPIAGLKRFLSPVSLRLFTCILIYTTLYRSFVQALVVVRGNFFSRLQRKEHKGKEAISTSRQSNSVLTLRRKALNRFIGIIKGRAGVASLAALLASPLSLSLLPGGDAFPTASIGLYLFTHSSSSLYNEGRSRGSRLVSWIPSWCDSSLLYAIGNGQLLWAFLFEQETFPQGYGNVILSKSSTYITPKPSHLPPDINWPSRRTIADHVAILASPSSTTSPFPSFTSPLLSSLSPTKYPTSPFEAINPILDYSPAHPAHTQLLCAMLHPKNPSCKQTLFTHFKSEWLPSAKFTGAFVLLTSVLFKSKRWAKDPETELFKVFVAILQGATVITGSIGTAWSMTCFLQQYLPRTFLPRARFFLNGLVSGIFILAVPKARRRELGLYVARMSAGSTWQILEKKGKVKPIPNGQRILLATALAILAGLYEVQSEHLSKATRGAAKRIFGQPIQEAPAERA